MTTATFIDYTTTDHSRITGPERDIVAYVRHRWRMMVRDVDTDD